MVDNQEPDRTRAASPEGEAALLLYRRLVGLALGLALLGTASCAHSPTGPSEFGTVDELVGSLLARDFSVSKGNKVSPGENGYFTVSSQDLLVNGARVKAFQYPSSARADADAALIGPGGQPRPRTQIDWIAPPHFYKHGRLIVLYLGCTATISRALEDYLGPAIVEGSSCGA